MKNLKFKVTKLKTLETVENGELIYFDKKIFLKVSDIIFKNIFTNSTVDFVKVESTIVQVIELTDDNYVVIDNNNIIRTNHKCKLMDPEYFGKHPFMHNDYITDDEDFENCECEESTDNDIKIKNVDMVDEYFDFIQKIYQIYKNKNKDTDNDNSDTDNDNFNEIMYDFIETLKKTHQKYEDKNNDKYDDKKPLNHFHHPHCNEPHSLLFPFMFIDIIKDRNKNKDTDNVSNDDIPDEYHNLLQKIEQLENINNETDNINDMMDEWIEALKEASQKCEDRSIYESFIDDLFDIIKNRK